LGKQDGESLMSEHAGPRNNRKSTLRSPSSRKSSNRRSNISIWRATAAAPAAPTLGKNVRADVCIVGAGIAGLTTAYLLTREGQSVVVVEKNQIGRGETSNTSAHLSNEIDATYREIERLHGEEGARLTAQSHSAAITQVESIVSEEEIDCDFERLDGYLFLGQGGTKKSLEEERQAARRAGLNVTSLRQSPFKLKLGHCLRFPEQGQFHPLKYLTGLVRAIRRAKGEIHAHTEATEIKGGKTAHVKTKNGRTISAGAVIVATDTPINDWVKIHTKQAAYRSYVIGAPVPLDSIPKALYWDTEDPFHYVRVKRMRDHHRSRDILIFGGEDHKTGQDDDVKNRYGRLIHWARTHFPGIGVPEFRWSGQVMNTIDGLAFIGRNPGDELNIYIATGDSGMGLTHGTIAGMVIRDLILGRDNPWATLYDPSRKSLRAAGAFAKENLNATSQYEDWVTPGEVSGVEEIKPGTGAILRQGMSKFAVYRDDTGKVHERSAVCPHLGCIVAWNAAERSWDCPCHGSRFSPDGAVLNGPAIGPLKSVKPRKVNAMQ
jgi:glycine/D-amino acid oxidase-like deaminating enzyme/nitrite reductase/ring-hydroxylating ferredoxin subunit